MPSIGFMKGKRFLQLKSYTDGRNRVCCASIWGLDHYWQGINWPNITSINKGVQHQQRSVLSRDCETIEYLTNAQSMNISWANMYQQAWNKNAWWHRVGRVWERESKSKDKTHPSFSIGCLSRAMDYHTMREKIYLRKWAHWDTKHSENKPGSHLMGYHITELGNIHPSRHSTQPPECMPAFLWKGCAAVKMHRIMVWVYHNCNL